jgi:hypothetical protein
MICSCMMCASDLDQHIVHACIARVIPPIVQGLSSPQCMCLAVHGCCSLDCMMQMHVHWEPDMCLWPRFVRGHRFLTGGPRHLFAAILGHQLPWIHQGRYDLVSWLVLCAGVHCAGVVLAVQCVCVLSLSHVCVGWCRLCSLAYLMQLYRLRGECNGK